MICTVCGEYVSYYEEDEHMKRHKKSKSSFTDSAIMGAVTDSALLGGILGGDIIGGILGDSLDGDLMD